MARSGDEPDAMYGLAAKSVRIADDGLTYRFTLRGEAKFHDGTPLTAHDVVWSLTTLKDKGHPIITQQLRDFTGAEAADDRTVAVRFADKRGRDVPLFVAGLPIFSKAYYAKQPFDQSTLDVPLGSGPYKVGRFDARAFHRIRAGEGLVGRRSAGGARTEQFRHHPLRILSRPRGWLRRLSPPRTICSARSSPRAPGRRATISLPSRMAASSAAVLPDDTPSGAQGWFINTRRKQFKDRRLREALTDAFDFEWTNKNIMYGSYERTVSVFQNSPMMAQGKPDAAELALLDPFRGKVPDEVFGEPYVPPVTDGSGHDLRWLRRGAQLLDEAGIAIKNGRRVLPDGTPVTIEFLLDEPTFTPHHLPYIKNLGTLGIQATLRVVDPVQYRARVDNFDFDVTVERMGFSSTPGDSLRTYFTSQAAKLKGSQNLAGIADPAMDTLVDRIIAAKTSGRANRCLPGARPRHPRRPLLDFALVQSVALDRLLGPIRFPGGPTALFPGYSGDLVDRQG